MNTHLLHRLKKSPGCRVLAGLICALGALLIAGDAHAQRTAPPDRMSYQGFLVDANGVPIANTGGPANFTCIFRIYDAASSGNLLWTEQQLVTIDKGNFSVMLGEGGSYTPEAAQHGSLTALFNNASASDRYIEVTVGSNRILPRLRLLPSGYSFLAAYANQLLRTNAGTAYLSYDAGTDRINAGSGLSVAGPITGTGSLSVSGALSAQSLSGNGSAITGLTANQLSGSLADSVLSANVALRNANNTFSQSQLFSANIGIGITTSPVYPLSFGTSLGEKIGLFTGDSGNYGFGVQSGLLQIHTDISTSDIAFGYGTSGSMGETMRIKGNGRVGIGTNSPQTTLHIASSGASAILLDSTTAKGGKWKISSETTGPFNILETNTYRITIAPGGSVGINTTQPDSTSQVKLDVGGRIRASGGFVPVGDESLRIVRGQVNPAGAIVLGSGFTVSHTAVGQFKITFTHGFGDNPVVTVSSIAGVGANYAVTTTSSSSVTISTASITGVAVDLSFNFIAVGAN